MNKVDQARNLKNRVLDEETTMSILNGSGINPQPQSMGQNSYQQPQQNPAPKNNKGFSYSSRNINGGKSKNFALRVEQDLFDEIQQLASDTGMSINGHIVQAIKEYLKKHSE